MSLKAFHIVFVTAAILTTAGYGLWELRFYSRTTDSAHLALAFVGLAGALILFGYGLWFLKKLRNISSL